MERTRWYKDRVFYQIWPRSFMDGNGDGVGDLWGVLEKLDYIQSLGADGIWFSPLYPSPGADGGYDISDYLDIAPEYGGMEAFKQLLTEAHQRGMKVIMDLVINHTSDEHPWFEKSRRREEPYTDYYIWRPAKPGGKLPNNWDSNFEGKAWTYDDVRGEYYLHLFAVKQPDLNMDNPLVREEVKKILRFWLDMGVDGFREDVITFISKEEGLPDEKLPLPAGKGISHYNHGPHIHEYLSEFYRDVFSQYDCLTLAEAPMITPAKALEYIEEKPGNELDMVIQFETECADCLFTDWIPMKFSLRKLKSAFSRWQTTLDGKAWNMLYIENHDHPRIISRYGSEKFRTESGKMLAVSYLFQKGTPFIYQGQEIGMTNWRPDSPDKYKDVQTIWKYQNTALNQSDEKRLHRLWRSARDSARTPVQWSSEPHAGFSQGKPWTSVNKNYRRVNVAAQEKDSDSLLNFYRKAIALRKNLDVVKNGTYQEHEKSSSQHYIYSRETASQKLYVICSFAKKETKWKCPKGLDIEHSKLILQNYKETLPDRLKPYETRVYLMEQ
ncbi:MAG: alpha-glucosidase [Lachnospiraceae bacterium]|nr:alpha-glucosidase [Lachnospiraceae bacterium]